MFADAGNVKDTVVVGFDCAVNVTLEVKISVKGQPKILCMRGRVTEDLNRKQGIEFFIMTFITNKLEFCIV